MPHAPLFNACAISGEPDPQLAVAGGVPWMVWIQAATEDGFSLETGGVARDARFRVVAAQRNGGRVTIVRTFPVTCDSPRAQGIGVGPSGWMVCWTHTRDGVTELLMATPAHAPRVIR
ncbi:MAG: hypothetical protein GX590_11960, partial [Lentisphaerae bacterium]|nr:hypothetical protein [Lentisphaerota bacterium]